MASSVNTRRHNIVEGAPVNQEVVWYPATTMACRIRIDDDGQDVFGCSTTMRVSYESSWIRPLSLVNYGLLVPVLGFQVRAVNDALLWLAASLSLSPQPESDSNCRCRCTRLQSMVMGTTIPIQLVSLQSR